MKNNNQKKRIGDFAKADSKAIQGIAILFMVMLHLFCRKENLPYHTSIIIKGLPLVYYLALWGDQCVALYCFCAGYASYLIQEGKSRQEYWKSTGKRLKKLMMNYWIIVILFSCIGAIFDSSGNIPGSLARFLKNFFLIDTSYNGAWWFMLIYLMLTALSGVLYHICKKWNPLLIIFGAVFFYLVAYMIRFEKLNITCNNAVGIWMISKVALFGTSLLPYIIGMLCYRLKVITILRSLAEKFTVTQRRVGIVIILVGCIAVHAIEEALILAPIFAMVTVGCAAVGLDTLNGKISRFFVFMGEHSLNIWLIHMFFYAYIFNNLVYRMVYPPLIYIFMFAICVGMSYIIKSITGLLGLIERRMIYSRGN